jgi:hypothetical protein
MRRFSILAAVAKHGTQDVRALGLTMLMTTCLVLANAQAGSAADGSNSTPPSFYVSFFEANDVGFVDPSTGEIGAVIPFAGSPTEMIADPARPIVYVVLGNQQIVAFQTKYQLPIGSVMLPAPCGSYAINGSGSKIYASSCGNQTVYVANTKTFTITGSIQLPSNGSGLAISNRRNRLYAALPSLHSVAIINVDNDKIERTKYLGQCRLNACSPDDVVVSPDGTYLISLDRHQCETVEYDLESDRVVGRTPDSLGHYCRLIGVESFTNELWLEAGIGGVVLGRYASVSMDPPFSRSPEFWSHQQIISVAFSPTGVGFGVGTRPVPGFRSPNILVAFPTLTNSVSLWSVAFSIVYIP